MQIAFTDGATLQTIWTGEFPDQGQSMDVCQKDELSDPTQGPIYARFLKINVLSYFSWAQGAGLQFFGTGQREYKNQV